MVRVLFLLKHLLLEMDGARSQLEELEVEEVMLSFVLHLHSKIYTCKHLLFVVDLVAMLPGVREAWDVMVKLRQLLFLLEQ